MPVVLLYEDDRELCGLLQELLAEVGYVVTVCATVDKLTATAAAHPDALALVDGWGGHFGALEPADLAQIRALTAQVPTIMMSARAWSRTTPAAALGALELLPKPFELSDLLVALERHTTRLDGESSAYAGTATVRLLARGLR